MAEIVTFTNMCMVCSGNKVLVQHRKKKDYSGITFPGGHVEPGESFVEAVIREVREETGLSITTPRLCGIKDWYNRDRRYVVLLYRTEQFSGTLQSSEEGEVWWEDLDRLSTHPLAAKDMCDMLQVFMEPDLSEFFYHLKNEEWILDLK